MDKELVEAMFLGVMNAQDRQLSLPLGAHVERNLLKRRLVAALAAIRDAGFVIVPREPTEGMTSAGIDLVYDQSGDTEISEIWPAMIAAYERKD